MSKLITVPIDFISIEDLTTQYQNNLEINFDNLGIIADQRTILSQILYTEYKLYKNPYKLMVNKNTYQSERKNIIQYIIEEIIITNRQKGNSDITINRKIQYLIVFIRWMNKENFLYLRNLDEAVNIFYRYTLFLKSKLRLSQYSQGEIHTRHSSVYKMLYTIFNDKSNILLSGITLITNSRVKKKVKSSNEDKKYHYNFYYNFFHQVTDFILNNEPYPLKLRLQLGHFWCLPSKHIFFAKENTFPMAFNPETGLVRSIDNFQEIYKMNNKSIIKENIKRFSNTLDKANLYKSQKRMELASHASKAFYMLFLTNTGMNDSTAATLLWNNQYSVDSIQQKFRNIKYRAGNKIVEFKIQTKFLSVFKKYLLLRNYILDGNHLETLFFIDNKKNARITSSLKRGTYSSYINKFFISNIDSNLPSISSRQLRVNKAYKVINQDGIIAASQILQSSVSTIMNSYLGESSESADIQLTNYYDQLNLNLFLTSTHNLSTNIGRCSNLVNQDMNYYDNDCLKSENCLFCQHYRIIVDKEDLQKLYSLKYLIHECRYIAQNAEHFETVYGKTYQRIKNIEEYILENKYLSYESLRKIELEVFEDENLHPYWEHKLNMLISIGLL